MDEEIRAMFAELQLGTMEQAAETITLTAVMVEMLALVVRKGLVTGGEATSVCDAAEVTLGKRLRDGGYEEHRMRNVRAQLTAMRHLLKERLE